MENKIDLSGLDKLQKDLKQVEKTMSFLNGRIAKLSFDPEDPAGVKAAIQEMEQAVDKKIFPYRLNPLVANIVKEAKMQFKNGILRKAKEKKLQNE